VHADPETNPPTQPTNRPTNRPIHHSSPSPHRNYGTEKEEGFQYNNGNVEPHRGFGHIAVACDDVYASCAKLEAVCSGFLGGAGAVVG
jgi:hypothetical protein